MNWDECAKLSEAVVGHSRFSLPVDGLAGFNCESGTTISDFTGGLAWLFTYVGDWILRIPAVNSFLELEPNHTGGYLSGFISFCAICIGLGLVGGVLGAISEAMGR